MQARLRNPYSVTNPISDPRIFFGPAAVLRILYSTIANNQSVSLVGPRHSGKSTLLRCLSQPAIQARFENFDLSHHLFVYLDVRNCLKKTSDGFLEFACEEIAATGQPYFELSSTKVGGDRFIDILRQVKRQGFHTVMLLDAFDEMARNKAFDPDFFLFLRAQVSDGLVSYVTASIRPLDQISHHDIQGSPFFNVFLPCHIKPLAPEEVFDLVMIPSQDAGITFTEEELSWVRTLGGRHPFFIMSTCNELFTFRETFVRPTSEQDRRALEEAIYRILSPHFHYLWDELSDDLQMQIMVKTQHSGTDTDTVDGRMQNVAESSLFVESSLFCRFVRIEHNFLDNTIEGELKEALKHLDSPSLLAKSQLRYLRLVSSRIEQRGATSVFEKGLIISDILTEAWKKLQGTALKYDILAYTYFSNTGELTQAGIAQRLFMSLRQYHREKDLAIKALARRLLEMEIACK